MSIRLPKAARGNTRQPFDHPAEPPRDGSAAPPSPARPSTRRPAPRPSGGQQPFFTAAGLALRWGMSERHVRRLIENGELRAHRFGKAVRISIADVLVYEAGCIAVT